MPRITIDDARAWAEVTKLNLQALDLDLLSQLEEEILALIGTVYDTSGWVDKSSTPRLVQVIIAKMYVGWVYNRAYSENQTEVNEYAEQVKENADMILAGIIDGTIKIPNVTPINSQTASFYPNDASSSMEPTLDDPSLGPAKF